MVVSQFSRHSTPASRNKLLGFRSKNGCLTLFRHQKTQLSRFSDTQTKKNSLLRHQKLDFHTFQTTSTKKNSLSCFWDTKNSTFTLFRRPRPKRTRLSCFWDTKKSTFVLFRHLDQRTRLSCFSDPEQLRSDLNLVPKRFRHPEPSKNPIFF